MSSPRRSGLLVPLFSIPSRRSWGIGEFLDLPALARWLQSAGQSFVQLLPINEMPPGERSPYSSMSAMALDPIFIAVPELEDFVALGGEGALTSTERGLLEQVRASGSLDYRSVRTLKERCLRRAFQHFDEHELAAGSARARAFEHFVEGEQWWLEEYVAFRSLFARFRDHAWWEWPHALAARNPRMLDETLGVLARERQFWRYVQWIAAEQWTSARQQALPVRVMGDLPFMVSANSPDVWARQGEFRRDATIGVPPDAFSADGQDWGLPPWRWEEMARADFQWIRRRAQRAASIYDGFRIDHVVGLYRTYIRPLSRSTPFFAPAEEAEQTRLGETIIGIYQGTGAEVTAEDLGTVPPFVRASLRRLGVPGYRVLRWEREWDRPGQPFVDPADYPELSVATPGTHDSETLAEWWTELPAAERRKVLELPSLRGAVPTEHWSASLRDAVLTALIASGSALVILPIHDLFGWTERINTPATVADTNWSWRLPWPVEKLNEADEPRERAEFLKRTCEVTRRGIGGP